MLRITTLRRLSMTPFISEQQEKATKKGWKDLFFKPKTRDERVKDYIPEVLEESLAAQRAVLAKENTERDLIVEHGQKMLKDLENKAPVTNMFPSFVALLKLYKKENLVTQRAMHLLMYPASTQVGAVSQAAMPELVSSFAENLRNFIDSVEQQGSYVHDVKWKKQKQQQQQITAGGQNATDPAAATKQIEERGGDNKAIDIEEPAAPADEAEPLDVTLFVKCMAGMSMANARLSDYKTAVRCADAALEHAMDPVRKGGVYALKAGLLVHNKQYVEASEAARLAIDFAPQNPQGYLHGATALRLLGRTEDALELLKLGHEHLPQNEAVAGLLEKTQAVYDKMPKQLEAAATATPAVDALPEGKASEKKKPQIAE